MTARGSGATLVLASFGLTSIFGQTHFLKVSDLLAMVASCSLIAALRRGMTSPTAADASLHSRSPLAICERMLLFLAFVFALVGLSCANRA